MHTRIIKALVDAKGKTVGGQVVPMPAGSYHEVSGFDLDYYLGHPDVFTVYAETSGPPVYADIHPVTGGIEGMSVSGTKLGAISAITYNADGTLHTYTQDAVLWTCAYDSSGRLSTETSTGTVKTYSYNADGTLASVTVV